MTTLFLTGSMGGGCWFGWSCGRSSFTACVWIGMVMMNMMSSTSMTSMSGVVLMSIMGSSESSLATAAPISDTPDIQCSQRGPPRGGGSEMKPTRAQPARCMAQVGPPLQREGVARAPRPAPGRRLGDEADAGPAGALHGVDGAADAAIRRVDVAADMGLGDVL